MMSGVGKVSVASPIWPCGPNGEDLAGLNRPTHKSFSIAVLELGAFLKLQKTILVAASAGHWPDPTGSSYFGF